MSVFWAVVAPASASAWLAGWLATSVWWTRDAVNEFAEKYPYASASDIARERERKAEANTGMCLFWPVMLVLWFAVCFVPGLVARWSVHPRELEQRDLREIKGKRL